MTESYVALVPLAVLMVGVLLQALLAGALNAKGKGWLAFLFGVGALGGVVAQWPAILNGRVSEFTLGRWDGPIQLAYRLDGLGFLFAVMAAGIGAAVLLYSVGYMEHEKGATRFYCLVLTFIAGLIHLVYTADLFLLYLSWELVGLCSFFLVGFWYRNGEAALGARKVLTITHLAGYGLFAAVLLLYHRAGSTLWSDSKVQGALTGGIFFLILVSAVAKSVQFPLHTWIPSAMAAPTPVSALLHAACYVKAGVYLVARLHSLGVWPAGWSYAVAWLGAVTLLVGVLFALAQHDLKRLLAFHTVSQIGYMMLGLGLGTPLSIAAALFHCLNHGLFKGGLFLCAGAVQHACGTRDMDRLGGLGRRMPHTMRIWLVCSAGIAGVPLLNGFVSKWMLYNAALEVHQPLLALIPWVGSILTAFSFLKATSGVFLGSDGEATAQAHEVSWTMLAGSGVLAAGCILFGVAPQLVVNYLLNPLLPAVGCAPLVGVSWFGLASGQSVWLASSGLALGLVALLFGLVVVWLPSLLRPAVVVGSAGMSGATLAAGAPTVFTGGEALGPRGHLGSSDFSYAAKHALAPFYAVFDADFYWLKLWRVANAAARGLARPLQSIERFGWILLPVLAAVVALFGSLAAGGHVVAAPTVAPRLSLLAFGAAVALVGLLLAAAATRSLRWMIAPMALAGAMALAGVFVTAELARTALLEAASVVALLMLWRRSTQRAAAVVYLMAIVLSAAGMLGGTLAAEHGHSALALALLLPAVAIKLGLVPLWLWLPLLAESGSALLAGLVIGVVDVAAFGEVLTLRCSEPQLFASLLPWIVLGALSAALGAVLALAQRDLKRLLAFSTIADLGMLIVAVAYGGELGLRGALLGATVHAIAKGLLFVTLSGPEACGETLRDARGLATRHPLGSLGFCVGSLAVLGVPPTLGYAAHWRIFSAAAGNAPLLTLLCLSAMLLVAVYARAIALFWWGPAAEAPAVQTTSMPPSVPLAYHRWLMGAAIVALTLVLLITGLWPRLLGGLA